MAPLIGISTNFLTVEQGKFLGMERVFVNKDYVDAVTRAGGLPLLLPPLGDTALLDHYVRLCDGFILSGGDDINPLLYGEAPHPCLEAFNTKLDCSQWHLTRAVLDAGKPLLAICRGVQLLNVVQGGTLWQDVSVATPPAMLHSQHAPRGDAFHTVHLASGSLLARLFGSELPVNSFHHQCLARLGDDLRPTAVAPDGIVEAVEMPTRSFVVGVQWHPEMLLTASDAMLPLFLSFIEACH